jgi:hypothetical protein
LVTEEEKLSKMKNVIVVDVDETGNPDRADRAEREKELKAQGLAAY